MDELKNFAVNNLFRLVIEVAYWDPRNWLVTYLGAVHQRGTVTTKQVQLGTGVRVQLQVGKVLGIPVLVTACCDNSEVSRMVT